MLAWGRRQENVTVFSAFFFFQPLSLFFLVLVICSFICRKYVGFFFILWVKSKFNLYKGKYDFFLRSLCW